MKCTRIVLEGYHATLDTYFLDESPEMTNSHLRPLVLVCPGGGYGFCSDREAEPIALAFAAQGFHAAVLRYPVEPARFPDALYSLGAAMLWLRQHAAGNCIDSEKITVTGYSAGGHLAASLGVFWNRPFLSEKLGCTPEQLRPTNLVLSYPVITSGEYAHRNSFNRLLGADASPDMLELVSLEKQVTGDVPPTFLWHTCTDELVPVENSLLFASALRKAAVPFELHIYSLGEHGLSLANEITEQPEAPTHGTRVCLPCAGWIDLAVAWMCRQFSEES